MERVKVRALRDVTVVLPEGEEATLNADHARLVADMGLLEIVEDRREGPSQTKPAKPVETKPARAAKPRSRR